MFKKLFFATALALAGVSTAHADDAPPPPLAQTWTDSSTGLTWSVCVLGRKITPYGCEGEAKGGPWYETVSYVTKADLGGFTDWRLPTLDELMTVIRCTSDQPGSVPDGALISMTKGSDGYSCPTGLSPHFVQPLSNQSATWTASWPETPGKNALPYQVDNPTRIGVGLGDIHPFEAPNQYMSGIAMLVRGGVPGPEWRQTLADSQTLWGGVLNELAGEHATSQQRLAERQQQARGRQQRSVALQASARPGTRTAQGLVVQVRGNVVQLQTYPHQECQVSSVYGQSCDDVPSRLVWVERASLKAPQ